MATDITTGQTSTGLVIANDVLRISSGGIASNTELNAGGSMFVYKGGTAQDTTVNSGGRVYVSSAGKALETTILSNGVVNLRKSGTMENTEVQALGQLHVSTGGLASKTTINGTSGYMRISAGGSADLTTVTNNGSMVLWGGNATNVFVQKNGNVQIKSAGAIMTDVTVSGGGRIFVSNGVVNSTNLMRDETGSGRMDIYGGEVNNTIVSGGRVYVSNGVLNSTTLMRDDTGSGRMDIYGGEVNNTIVSGVLCVSGGIVKNTQVFTGGSMYIRNMINEEDNTLISYGTASNVVISGGRLVVEAGTAEDIQVSNGGILSVSGGVINDTVISSGGKVSVYNDAVLNGVQQQSGTLVLSGGTLNGATVNGGIFQVHSGVANDVTIDTEKDILVRSGAEINNMTVNGGKVVVSSGAEINNMTVNGGNVVVSSGGVIKNTAMNTAEELGADQYDLTVSAGGTVKGTLELSGSAKMVFRQNSFLELSVCDMDATSDYLINDVSRITNVTNAKTTAVLSADQTVGAFRIALNGNSFGNQVTLKAGDVTICTLSANKGSFTTEEGVKYELVRGDGKIHLTIGKVFFINNSFEEGKSGNYTWNVNAQATVAGAVEQNADVVYVLGGKLSGTTAFDCTTGVIENTTGAAMVLGGVRHEGESKKFTTIEKDIALTILNGKFNSNVIGGTALVAGSVEQKGDIVLNIAGGTFAKQVAGGMYHASDALTDQTILEGNVNFTISGGTFNGRVYGGSFSYDDNSAAARSTLIGNVNLTIDASEKLITFQKDVVAGSRHTGVIEGNVTVTVSGLGSNLSFEGYLWGGCSGDYYQNTSAGRDTRTGVTGSRTVNFTGFTGDFDANIYMFDTFVAGHDTDVNFTNAKLNLSDVKSWTFKSGSTIAGVAINNFTGDTLAFDTTGLGDAAWEMYSGSVAGFEMAKAVTLGGQEASWDGSAWASADYKLTLDEEENSLILSKLA